PKQGGNNLFKLTNKTVASVIDKLNENETLAATEDISQLLSNRISKSKDNNLNDDLIVSLSNAYENKRARQVVEWENIRRQNVQRAA
ncbi:MAG: hypothetical protein ABWZ66_04265, partial [Pyrinomonadaceae bacterium]